MLCNLKYIFPFILLAYSVNSNGQTSSYGELQAAYIFNFAKYIKWPGNADVFVIGVAGETDILDALQNTLKGKKVGGREIEIRTITTPEEAAKCRIVYLPASNSAAIDDLRMSIFGKNFLIVTEEDLIRRGACISFVVENDRLRFKLRKAALEAAGLEASEGLLKLAILI
jgi:hypothetical protein